MSWLSRSSFRFFWIFWKFPLCLQSEGKNTCHSYKFSLREHRGGEPKPFPRRKEVLTTWGLSWVWHGIMRTVYPPILSSKTILIKTKTIREIIRVIEHQEIFNTFNSENRSWNQLYVENLGSFLYMNYRITWGVSIRVCGRTKTR